MWKLHQAPFPRNSWRCVSIGTTTCPFGPKWTELIAVPIDVESLAERHSQGLDLPQTANTMQLCVCRIQTKPCVADCLIGGWGANLYQIAALSRRKMCRSTQMADELHSMIGAHVKPPHSRASVLALDELRLIADADMKALERLAYSPHIHAVDAKGDTPLHIAARMGHLAMCDLFVRAGANLLACNNDRLTPAEVARAEGHEWAAQLMSALIQHESSRFIVREAEAQPVAGKDAATLSEPAPTALPESPPAAEDEFLFVAEEEPESVHRASSGTPVFGVFLKEVVREHAGGNVDEIDWDLDTSDAELAGEGVGRVANIRHDAAPPDGDRTKRRSHRNLARPSGTSLAIDADECLRWTLAILEKGRFSSSDLQFLISGCIGDGDPEDLRVNLALTLEAAGLEYEDDHDELDELPREALSDISAEELAEGIEAGLTRSTRLPGSGPFLVSKDREELLIREIVQARNALLLEILSSEPAIRIVIGMTDRLAAGLVEAKLITTRAVSPTARVDPDSIEFFEAANILRAWDAAGRVTEGKRRREALAALAALDLSLLFLQALSIALAEHPDHRQDSARLGACVTSFAAAVEHLSIEHMPHARRYAHLHAREGEDPEDVFQVAFIGLQKSIRRFDPERGVRFIVYATFWMRQSVSRWRADEGAIVRIPVHLHQKLSQFDDAVKRLEEDLGREPSSLDIAAKLECYESSVSRLRRIPRRCVDLREAEQQSGDEGDGDPERALAVAETSRLVLEALEELPSRYADVLRRRFGIGHDEEMTLEEVGQLHGVTRERIRQIEAKALLMLAHPARSRRMRALLGTS